MGIKTNMKGKINDKFESLFIKGTPGDPGKSAYEIAIENGYQGTEGEFVNHVVRLKDVYDHINGSKYDFKNDQQVYVHDDESLYKGRNITEMFKEMNDLLSSIEEKITPVYLTTGEVIRQMTNGSASSFTRSASMPASGTSIRDISKDGDGSIFTWYDSTTTTQYYYTDADIIYMNEDSSDMFRKRKSLSSVDLSSFDTSNVTDMSGMFKTCESLTSLDLSKFNTSNVTSMSGMFEDCESLVSINLSNFDTSKVTDTYNMFSNCSALTSLDVSSFDTSNVTDMSGMFYYCSALTILDLSNFDTSNVMDIYDMFSGCSSLTSLDVSNFNISNVMEISNMFSYCSSLTSLDLSSFDTSNVIVMHSMFNNCTALLTINFGEKFTNISVDDITSSTLSNGTYMMFYECSANKPTGGNWDLGTWNEDGTFIKSSEIGGSTEVYLAAGSNINGAINKSATQFIRSTVAPDASITTTDISKDSDKSIVTWYDSVATTQYYYTDADILYLNENSSSMFLNCSLLASLDLSGFNSSNVTNMGNMFNKCNKLASLNISTFDTSNVTDMRFMFSNCNALTSLDLSKFNTQKVQYMNDMFSNCSVLTTLDLSNFDTSNVIAMENMFSECSLLTSVNASSFNTLNITDMSNMFSKCSSLVTLDLHNFNTQKLKKSDYMFRGCSSLTSLNVSSFNTPNLTSLNWMFNGCSSLTSLDLSNFDTTNASNLKELFEGCSKLSSIIYGTMFILNTAIYSSAMNAYGANNTYYMYNNCPANKPTGGNWNLGTWNAAGTFIKS